MSDHYNDFPELEGEGELRRAPPYRDAEAPTGEQAARRAEAAADRAAWLKKRVPSSDYVEPLQAFLPDIAPPVVETPKGAKTGVARRADARTQYAAEVERQAAYLMTIAKSADDLAAVERFRDEALKNGPDHTRYRKGSTFAEPTRFSLDGNEAIRIRTRVLLLMKRSADADRENAKAEGKRKMTRTIPRGAIELLDALIALARKYRKKGSEVCLYPSLARLAGMTGTDADTVSAAIKVLVMFGIITVTRRIKHVAVGPMFKGKRTVQDTNSYVIHSQPATLLGALAFKRFGIFSVPNYSVAIKPSIDSTSLIGASETDSRQSPYVPPMPDALAAIFDRWGALFDKRKAAEGGGFLAA